MISSIYSHGQSDAPTGQEAENRNAILYQKAWQERGLIILDPATITDDWVRQVFINEAEKRYLKRMGK